MVLSMLFWGLAWPISKMMTAYISPYEVAAIRYALVSLSLIPVMVFLHIPFKLPKQSLVSIFLVCVFNVLYTLAFYVGLSFGNAGIAGVIVATLSPIIASAIGSFIHHYTLSRPQKIGLFFGVISGCFLMRVDDIGLLLSPFNLIFLAAAFLYAAISLASKTATTHIDPISLNFYSSLFVFVAFLPSFFFFDPKELLGLDYKFWFYVFIASLISTTFATTIFYKGIGILGITKGGSFMLLVPVFALLLSWLLLGEIPTTSTLIGGAIAMIGVYLINFFRPFRFSSKK
ncbi:hypothetical protein BJI48_07250 [Helicobacter sp. 11S02596-1]|nr:hypothetical protein BJI48_07250 [Helicobacter sp. 11S02596-1]